MKEVKIRIHLVTYECHAVFFLAQFEAPWKKFIGMSRREP
jgi:hypothetical protein